MNKNYLAYLLLILTTIFWSGNFIVGKAASAYQIPPFSLNFYRWLFAGLILLPFTFKEILNKKGVVISLDTYNSGIHFLGFEYPYYIVKKIIRSSLSDLICKGVKPKYYFLSGGGNKQTFTKKNLSLISKSLKEEQKKYSIIVGGGDTVYSKIPSFSVTTIGFAKKIIERNKAKKDDDIYVTGNIGDSFIGLKIMQNKYFMVNKLKKYFINKYLSLIHI